MTTRRNFLIGLGLAPMIASAVIHAEQAQAEAAREHAKHGLPAPKPMDVCFGFTAMGTGMASSLLVAGLRRHSGVKIVEAYLNSMGGMTHQHFSPDAQPVGDVQLFIEGGSGQIQATFLRDGNLISETLSVDDSGHATTKTQLLEAR